MLTRQILLQALLDKLIGNGHYKIKTSNDGVTTITIPDSTDSNTVTIIDHIMNLIIPTLVPIYLNNNNIDIMTLIQASPSQINTYITNNVTSLAQAQVYLYKITLLLQALVVQDLEIFPTS